jgi:ABC-2 type transport system ATP-binding protein
MQDNLINTRITLKEIYKYENDNPILNNVTLEVKKGQIYTYFGSLGSGKTTTINLILGLIKPSSGTVKILGVDPFPNCDAAMKVRKRIGAVLKGNDLSLNLTGMDNLLYWANLYGLNEDKAKNSALNVLRKVKLSEWADVRVSKYSYGMKMRLSIARASVCFYGILDLFSF